MLHLSTNPYTSLVVMVLKKEGNCCMCLDFRALNKLMVRDKSPILVIDDLLDELHGAKFFNVLDLRFRYHQIWMDVVIPKISFCSHEGHYEFLMMPCSLCNAPSTFQTLMNKLFYPFLCNCVLVFFDDILIYRKTWEAHVWSILRKLYNYSRRTNYSSGDSKCAFGAFEVEYLGHIISRTRV